MDCMQTGAKGTMIVYVVCDVVCDVVGDHACSALARDHLGVEDEPDLLDCELLVIGGDEDVHFGPKGAKVSRKFDVIIDRLCEQLLMRADALRHKAGPEVTQR